MNNKYFIQIYGCQMNYSDGERISAIFEDLEYSKSETLEDADVLTIITCSVRQRAEDRVDGLKERIIKLKEKNPHLKIILTGCMANRDFRTITDLQKKTEKEENYKRNLKVRFSWVDYILNINEISKLYEIFGEKSKLLNQYLSINPKYNSKFQAYVPISTGCNNFCSYCIVPFTRGREVSRPFDEVLKEVSTLIERGYKEINLLGQNVNSYGNDLGEKNLFAKLLSDIDKFEGDFWIRFVSSHPKDVSEELIDTIKDSKHIVPQIHFALQSGNNEILKKMNRPYTIEKYLEIVKMFKEKIPNIAITSDIIVGFPGETDLQFEDTKKALEKINFSMIYLNEYSPRKGTKSFLLKDDIPAKIKHNRKEVLNDILIKTAKDYNKKFLKQEIKVLITEESKGFLFGHNAEGVDVKVEVSKNENCLKKYVGQFIKAKIDEIGSWSIKGTLV